MGFDEIDKRLTKTKYIQACGCVANYNYLIWNEDNYKFSKTIIDHSQRISFYDAQVSKWLTEWKCQTCEVKEFFEDYPDGVISGETFLRRIRRWFVRARRWLRKR